ncbi:MAG: hypothetical protein UH543_03410 [Bacteroidales bacterium]|jgi:uncharacterized membrane protein YcjF (UPF0283 family)|nr:hypothetical protein [Bacteroidales bacterium]MEE0976772.1 hypothetical protein [Bacteroidales bacterium]
MNKFFVKNTLKAFAAAVLIVVMWIFQYYPDKVDFKFWLGLVVVMAILIYLIAMVSSLCRKIVSLEKEKTEKQVVETQDENPEL